MLKLFLLTILSAVPHSLPTRTNLTPSREERKVQQPGPQAEQVRGGHHQKGKAVVGRSRMIRAVEG